MKKLKLVRPTRQRQQSAGLTSTVQVLRQINIFAALPFIGLLVLGVTIIYLASLSNPEASFLRHLIGIALGMVGAVIAYRTDCRKFKDYAKILLIIDLILILAPLLPGIGSYSKGIHGWIKIPGIGFTLQTSELAKIVTIFYMASLTSAFNGQITQLKDYLKLCGALSIPFVCIMAQPDLGTGLVLLVSGALIIVVGGAQRKWIIVTLAALIAFCACVIITDPLLDKMAGHDVGLKAYQMDRLTVFLDDSSDAGYNVRQAKIAVGSGSLMGKQLGSATQSTAGFLPESHTDFIFAFFAEQFGFVGAALLILLFLWLCFGALRIGHACDSQFASLICVGIASVWAFQLLESAGMCMGMMPVTGIPLPFISFGASSMIAQVTAFGIIQSLWRTRSRVGSQAVSSAIAQPKS